MVVVVMLRHLLCNARVHMAGLSSAAVLLLYRDLRGVGRAVLIYMRCAARDTITTIIITTTTTITMVPTRQALPAKMKVGTCWSLHRLAEAIIYRVLLALLWGILGRMMLWCGCGCGLGRSWMSGVTVVVMEALGLIRGLTPIRTRMWMRTMMVLMGYGLGMGLERIEHKLSTLCRYHAYQRLSSHSSSCHRFPMGSF